MALPGSPPISLQQIYTEFGAPLGTPLTQMVRGGAYVPLGVSSSIPTAPPISLLDFLGASNLAAFLAQVTASAGALSPNDATATILWQSNGQCRKAINNAASTLEYNWLVVGANNQFELRSTNWSGPNVADVTGSAKDTWISGATGVSWTLTNTNNVVSTKLAQFDIQCRRASDGVIIATAAGCVLEAVVDV